MSDSLSIAPGHIQQAKAALRDAGIPVAIGQQVLDLATALLTGGDDDPDLPR